LLAVHWSRVADVLKQAGDLSGKVIISCSLPMNTSDTALAVAHTLSGAEVLAKKVRKANVISAFSTVPSEVLFDVFKGLRSRSGLSVSASELRARHLQLAHFRSNRGEVSDATTSEPT
jgi:predicted dinucleotide-binding enzyme